MTYRTKVAITFGVVIASIITANVVGEVLTRRSVAPPHEATPARIESLARSVDHYVYNFGRLPASLAEVASFQGADLEVRDGWDRALLYQPDTHDERAEEAGFTLCSAGPDGRFGSGDDVCGGRRYQRR